MIIQCLLLFYLNVYLSIAVTINKFSPPTVILKEGDSLHLACLNYDNYQFIYPSSESNNMIETSPINIEESIDSLSKKPMGVLKRCKTVFGDTGWYGCRKTNSQFSNYNDSDNFRIYVYVNSTESRFVNKKSFEFLLGETSDQITIPCRPTSPSYTVELFQNENLISNNRRIEFDPKEGFLISDLTISDIGEYKCKIKNFDYQEEPSFFLHIISKIKKINKPVISDYNGQMKILKGNDLQLNCSVEIESSILFSLQWTKPNQNKILDITEEYFENPMGINFYQQVKQLTVKNVSNEDQGIYKCCIESGLIIECTQTFITVQEHHLDR